MKAAEKRVALAAIADGRAGLVVGTHAVLTDSVVFKNLGLAIVDEQHRFGACGSAAFWRARPTTRTCWS